MWDLRKLYPLHYMVFRQTASHLPHEGNSENAFSRAGNLSDPNINPLYLSKLTKIGINKKVYEPLVGDINDRYFTKFSKNGRFSEDDDGTHGLVTSLELQEGD